MLLGFPLGSRDIHLLPQAQAIIQDGLADYVELHLVDAGSWDIIAPWFDIVGVIHAKDSYEEMVWASQVAEQWSIPWVFHGGYTMNPQFIEDVRKEHVKEFENNISKTWALVENSPRRGWGGEYFVATDVESILAYGTGFCLDASHAIKAGGWSLLMKFLELNPAHFHITDGDSKVAYEKEHMPLGKGNYPLRDIQQVLPDTARITIESERNSKNSLKEIIADLKYWRRLCGL